MSKPVKGFEPRPEPKCRNCWDKGFSTVLIGGAIVRGDFVGDPDMRIPVNTEIRYCKCAKGKRMAYTAKRKETCARGEIGKRTALKMPRRKRLVGSIPTARTKKLRNRK